MKRISIVGNSAAGKSTLSKRMGAHYGIDVHTIDKIYWLANWQLRDQESFHQLHTQWLSAEKWIIDGIGYWDELKERLCQSEYIVFLDVTPERCKDQARCRIESEKKAENTDITRGCKYRDNQDLQMHVIDHFHAETRPKLIELLSALSSAKVDSIESAEHLRFEPDT